MNDLDEIIRIRKSHIGRYVFELNKAFKQISIPYIRDKGFEEFTEGQMQILGQLSLTRSTPVSQVTENLEISKQAISRMISLCEKNGYIKKTPSKEDSRSVNIEFTKKGKRLLTVAVDAIKVAEADFEKRLGKKKFKELKNILSDACNKLDLINID